MNTLNFKPFPFNEKTWLDEIFYKHGALVLDYNKFEPNKIDDFDINVYKDQQILKDFLQIRFTEELVEALDDIQNPDHFKEELTDAFNFLIAAYYIYGWRTKDLISEPVKLNIYTDNDIKLAIMNIIQKVGMTCNTLKNRPWRKSQYLVDLYIFEERFKEIWILFYSFLRTLYDDKIIFEQWSLKYQVNRFRLDSDY